MVSMLIAYDSKRRICDNEEMFWFSGFFSDAIDRFFILTKESAVIMGRKTFEKIGFFPECRNIVLTNSADLVSPSATIHAGSLAHAMRVAADYEEAYVLGGESVFLRSVRHVDCIFAIEFDGEYSSEKALVFPELDSTWIEKSKISIEPTDRIPGFNLVCYEKKQNMNMRNARFDEQREVMRRVGGNGACLFCPGQLAKCHTQEILYQNEHWLLTYNQRPYKNTELHLLAISKQHVNSLNEMRTGAGEALFDLLKWSEDYFGIDHGAICIRFGDIRFSGATVGHMHAHLIVSKKDISKENEVYFKVGDSIE